MKNKKNVLLIGLVIALTIIILVIIFLKKSETNYLEMEPSVSTENGEIDMANLSNSQINDYGIKENKSSKIAEGIEFNDLYISDIKIEASKNISTFNAKVENTLGKDLPEYTIYLIFLDESGNEIAKIETLFPKIETGKIGYISATTTKDIATAYELKIERKESEITLQVK